ncbi:hypothetical protein SASPL_130775 [Salvia splendens]|uniref:Uncharacterized protein n=1 Tax=Salvia splendens TaxID=180675 RepID=A0A8X8ZJR2_SALSN|nr:hypothetical protein SASPL_130775 [Salvia splendens]
MMQLTAASVGLLSLVLPPSAEADTGNAIMDIFGELGRKLGLIKPKDEGKEEKPKDESEGKSKIAFGVVNDAIEAADGDWVRFEEIGTGEYRRLALLGDFEDDAVRRVGDVGVAGVIGGDGGGEEIVERGEEELAEAAEVVAG